MGDAVYRMRQLRKKRKLLGVCTRCGRTKDDSFSTCEKCRSEYRRYSREENENSKVKIIRSLRKWKITNPQLLRKLNETGMTLFEFSGKVGVSLRTAERWLFEGAEPTDKNKLKVNSVLSEDVYDL